ncbi:hypothetical protein KA405_00060 [Patescibacteria group bacterium]|nr:hypothetical protein [Patescibacteria group bacterium]
MSNETTDTCIIDNLECQDFNNQDYNQLIIDIHNKKGIDKKLKDKYKTAINEDYLTVKQTNQSKMHIILSQFQELLDEVISTTDSALQLRLF